jgi:hypothetical protein
MVKTNDKTLVCLALRLLVDFGISSDGGVCCFGFHQIEEIKQQSFFEGET